MCGYKGLSRVLGRIPPSCATIPAYVSGLAVFLLSPNKRQIVRDNLARPSGRRMGWWESNKLALRGYFSYSRYWVEALGLTQLSRRELSARMSFNGFENVFTALGQGKGVIFTTPHLGNWDFGAAWLASSGHPITAVMEELEPRELYDWFSSHRITFGVRVIPASASAFGELAKTLARNEVVALVADRDIVSSGVKVPFFGEAASVPQGVALLSLRTGAPIIPAAVYMLPGGGHYAIAMEPIRYTRTGLLRDDVAELTGLLVSRFESLIRAAPTQWHLFQPNWPSQMENGDSGSTI
ncbi:MAG: hypothetical protein M0Z96_01680 [Actinomycetota bacterium]|nr:hypothetical protein [Actinomycetota bacterium]